MDPVTAGLMMGGGSLLSGLGGFLGSQTQAGAAQNAGQMGWLGSVMATQAANQGYERANAALSPYSSAGQRALSMLMSYLQGNNAQTAGIGGGGANLMSTFAPTMEQLEKTPGYQWAKTQALGAMTNSGAARGLGTSGNLLQNIGETSTGLASQTFQQQLDNYMRQNLQAYNMLFNPSQMGANAAQGIASAATGAAGQMGSALTNAGTSLGQGIMGQANALAGGTNALFGGLGNAATTAGYFGGGYNRPSNYSGIPSQVAYSSTEWPIRQQF